MPRKHFKRVRLIGGPQDGQAMTVHRDMPFIKVGHVPPGPAYHVPDDEPIRKIDYTVHVYTIARQRAWGRDYHVALHQSINRGAHS